MRGEERRGNDAQHPVYDILKDFSDAILLTASELKPGRLRGRPMLVSRVDEDGTMWLFASAESRVREAMSNGEAYVVCQSSTRQVFLRGQVLMIADRSIVDSLWTSDVEKQFPNGKNDGKLCLVRFETVEGEYWDHSGMKGARYFLDTERGSFSVRPSAPPQPG